MMKSITSYFQSNAVCKPKMDEILIQKRFADADNRMVDLQTKFARPRKQPDKKSNLEQSDKKTNLEQSDKNFNFEHEDLLLERSYPDDSSVPSDSFSSIQTSSSTTANINSSKTSSCPSLTAQRRKIEQVHQFDRQNGSLNYEVLKATMYGIQCEVCELTLKDISCIIRFDDNGKLLKHCHIGSDGHSSC
jgi:hypothetical protein